MSTYPHHPATDLVDPWHASVFSEGTNSGACRELQRAADRSSINKIKAWPQKSFEHVYLRSILFTILLKMGTSNCCHTTEYFVSEKSAFTWYLSRFGALNLCHVQKSPVCISCGNLGVWTQLLPLLAFIEPVQSMLKLISRNKTWEMWKKHWKNREELERIRAFSEGTGQVPPRASGSGPHLVSLLSTLILFNRSQRCSRQIYLHLKRITTRSIHVWYLYLEVVDFYGKLWVQ